MATKEKIENEPWYTTDDDIPITVRFELEQRLGVQLMTRFDGNPTDPSYNHIVWEAPAMTADEEPKRRPGRKKKVKRGPKPKPKPDAELSEHSHEAKIKENLVESRLSVPPNDDVVGSENEVITVSEDEKDNSEYIEVISVDDSDNDYDVPKVFTHQVGHSYSQARGTTGYTDYDNIPSTSRGYTHALINALEKPFSCKRCGEPFPHAWMVLEHLRIHDSGEKPFKCPISVCGKSFSNRSNLHTHQRAMDHHDWEFKCNKCEKPFNKSVSLNRHRESACRNYKAIMAKKNSRKGKRRKKKKATKKTTEIKAKKMELNDNDGDIIIIDIHIPDNHNHNINDSDNDDSAEIILPC